MHTDILTKEENMKQTKTLVNSALATALAVGFGMAALDANAAKPKWEGYEKCAGIAKKGMNDCGTSKHNCAGHAASDNDSVEWVYLPAGRCAKIAGGTIKKQASK